MAGWGKYVGDSLVVLIKVSDRNQLGHHPTVLSSDRKVADGMFSCGFAPFNCTAIDNCRGTVIKTSKHVYIKLFRIISY
jgi:hypothetical protein